MTVLRSATARYHAAQTSAASAPTASDAEQRLSAMSCLPRAVEIFLGWIGVALSGSNTSTNAMFGAFQLAVGKILGFPPLLLPTLNSVGAEVGKPVAPQTASVGVSTSRFVRNEGEVIRHNMGWTFVMLIWLIVIGVGFYWFLPTVTVLG
jgi:L-lactate permease